MVVTVGNNEKAPRENLRFFFNVGQAGLDIALVIDVSGIAVTLMGKLQRFKSDIRANSLAKTMIPRPPTVESGLRLFVQALVALLRHLRRAGPRLRFEERTAKKRKMCSPQRGANFSGRNQLTMLPLYRGKK